jgi:hypothetical protein
LSVGSGYWLGGDIVITQQALKTAANIVQANNIKVPIEIAAQARLDQWPRLKPEIAKTKPMPHQTQTQ